MRKQKFNQPGVILGDTATSEQALEDGMIDTVQWASPSSGGTVQINDNTTLLMLDNASLLLELTINLPLNPTFDRMLTINARSAVTSLTLAAPGTGQTLYTNLTLNALDANSDYNVFFSSDKQAWCRR